MNKETPILDTNERKILFLIFFVAFLIRIVGVNYGYWHGDERINDAAKVLAGQLVPGQHFYPPLLNYINAVFLAILYGVGRLIPVWHSVADFRAQYFSDPTVFFLTCRSVSAAFSAATAPLFYLIAKSLSMSRKQCLIAGGLGITIPVMVYLAHLSKSDVHLASSAIFVFYCLIKNYENPKNIMRSFVLGFAIALAMSFKHSYIFILVPLMLGHLFLLIREHGFPTTAKSLAWCSAIMLPAWSVMNIGILLDFQNFLDFQKIQTEMSVRSGHTLFEPFIVLFQLAQHHVYGVGPLIILLFFAFPLYIHSSFSTLKYRMLLTNFWSAVAFSSIIIALMSGDRQHSGLWLPVFTCMHLFACLVVIDALAINVRLRHPIVNSSAWIAVLLSFSFSFYGVASIFSQSLALSNASSLAAYIREHHSSDKILSSTNLNLPQASQARDSERERHERLAQKYGIAMPERAEENNRTTPKIDTVYYQNMPQVMFGLENADEESLAGFIKPYAWPPQLEEWQLDNWLDQGFSIFVVASFNYYRHEAPQEYFRNFYTSLEDRCHLIKYFEPIKPYFLEFPVSVFDCGTKVFSSR